MKEKIEVFENRINTLKKSLKIEELAAQKIELESASVSKDFWKDTNKAKDIMQKISEIENTTSNISEIEEDVSSLKEYLEISKGEDINEIENECKKIDEKIAKLEFKQYLSGKYDQSNALLSIHAGQGGTEANDWAEMLLRMYTRFAEKQGWTVEEVHKVRGEETGISTVTIEITGKLAFGYLKKETGTHRLVRLSPFNAQNLRQTSFAGVEVTPIFEDEDDSDIEIKKEDIDFKATKSGGPGGQNVNKTATAVTITHIPTGITIHSSSQRSQLQNRESAMKLLKSKLWMLQQEKIDKERKQIKGEHKVAAWGNQIRNYVLHPYKLVKDLRTKVESTDPEGVLDGNIDKFIQAEIKI